jgi:hypothetical protein
VRAKLHALNSIFQTRAQFDSGTVRLPPFGRHAQPPLRPASAGPIPNGRTAPGRQKAGGLSPPGVEISSACKERKKKQKRKKIRPDGKVENAAHARWTEPPQRRFPLSHRPDYWDTIKFTRPDRSRVNKTGQFDVFMTQPAPAGPALARAAPKRASSQPSTKIEEMGGNFVTASKAVFASRATCTATQGRSLGWRPMSAARLARCGTPCAGGE